MTTPPAPRPRHPTQLAALFVGILLAGCKTVPEKPLLVMGPLHAAIETQNIIGSGNYHGILRAAVSDAAPSFKAASVRELAAHPDHRGQLSGVGDCASEACLLQVASRIEASAFLTLHLRLTSAGSELSLTLVDPATLQVLVRSVAGPAPTSDTELHAAVEGVVAESLREAGSGLTAPWRQARGGQAKTTRRAAEPRCSDLLERSVDLPLDDLSLRDREAMIQLLLKLLAEQPPRHPRRSNALRELAALYWERVRALVLAPGYCKYSGPCPPEAYKATAQRGFNACNEVLEHDPEFSRTDHVLFLRGCHLLGLGNEAAARQDFARLARDFPQSPWLQMLRHYDCLAQNNR